MQDNLVTDLAQLLLAAHAAADALSESLNEDFGVGNYDDNTRYRHFVSQSLAAALDKFPTPSSSLPYADEHVDIDRGGHFLCLCGNTPQQHGFYPCGPDGSPSDEVIEADSNCPPLWRCDQCQRIFHGQTGTVLAEPFAAKKPEHS